MRLVSGYGHPESQVGFGGTMDLPSVLAGFASLQPRTLTFLPTYRCTAACKQCCFESSPQVRGRLSLDLMLQTLDDAHASFPSLEVVVFSGGECFLLGEDLFTVLRRASDLGLVTRCVTNGYWGKAKRSAERIAGRLVDCGLRELNLSTGADHQQWVAFESVVNCAAATVRRDIFTLITIEKDGSDSRCWNEAQSNETVCRLKSESPTLFRLQSNVWMAFREGHRNAGNTASRTETEGGCAQLFSNLVVTPYSRLSACCGLTHEHIPEMQLGSLRAHSVRELFDSQFSDFLKLWIHIDGPSAIVRKVLGERGDQILDGTVHICESCAILHKSPEVLAGLRERYAEFLPDVLARASARELAHRIATARANDHDRSRPVPTLDHIGA